VFNRIIILVTGNCRFNIFVEKLLSVISKGLVFNIPVWFCIGLYIAVKACVIMLFSR
jgi:hypothetical protein